MPVTFDEPGARTGPHGSPVSKLISAAHSSQEAGGQGLGTERRYLSCSLARLFTIMSSESRMRLRCGGWRLEVAAGGRIRVFL